LFEPFSLKIPLSGITNGGDTIVQKVITLIAGTDNPELVTKAEVTYLPGATTGLLILTLKNDKNGEAKVTLTVKDDGGTQNGGVDTSEKSFKVKVTGSGPKMVITLTDLSGNVIVTGLDSLPTGHGIRFYPNPTTGVVNIDAGGNSLTETEVKVFNMLGAEIPHKIFRSGRTISVDLSHQARGTYLIELHAGGEFYTQKVILER
jgi:hypothetical protein